jgi:hypothetical protein
VHQTAQVDELIEERGVAGLMIAKLGNELFGSLCSERSARHVR